MFTTKGLSVSIKDVPDTWIFEFYCGLKNKLKGNSIRIKSLFKKEKTPSMFIYMNENGVYKFKDFSSGNLGSSINLVMKLFSISYSQACTKIISDYNNYILKNGCYQSEFNLEDNDISNNKYSVVQFNKRQWTQKDAEYWTKYNISSSLLEKYNVYPLSSYTMYNSVLDNSFEIKGTYIYGYFKKDGSLYKIYQPLSNCKFITIDKEYIQGIEQTENNNTLVITSSLKDILSLMSLNLKIDSIAFNSESSFISKELAEKLKTKYKNILIMYDNDEAGILYTEKLAEKYAFTKCYLLGLSKDISDSIKDYGVVKTFYKIVIAINSKI